MEKIIKKKRKHPILRYLEYKIFHIQDRPHSIALGVAIGFFIAPNPLLGLHLIMIFFLCILFRANKLSAFVSTTVSNFLTIVPMFYADYIVGYRLYGIFGQKPEFTHAQIVELFKTTFSADKTLSAFYSSEYWYRFWGLLKAIGPELWLGSLVIGVLAAICGYGLCYIAVRKHRAGSRHRRHRLADGQ